MAKKTIEVTDLILRDAHQSLLATRMAMEDMVPVCEDLDNAGYWSLECWGGATFDSCIRFLNEDPWERLRTVPQAAAEVPTADAAARTESAGLSPLPGQSSGAIRREGGGERHGRVPLLRRAERLAQSADVDQGREEVPASTRKEPFATPSARCTRSTAFVEMAQQLKEMGCDSICIKDMAGC